MAQISADRVRDTSTSTGTGAFVVTGTAPTAFRTFSAVCTTNDTFYYAIQHQTANEWEVGLGTYSSANTITRTTVYASSAGGSAVTFSSGTKDVFLTLAATRTVQLDENGAIAGITDAGNLTFTGNARRITGDFSNATIANRVMFQNSVTNGASRLGLLPNGTSVNASWDAWGNSDPVASAYGRFGILGATEVAVQSDRTGAASYLPMTFYTGGSERVRIDTSGNVGIGTSSPAAKLDVNGTIRGNGNISTADGSVFGWGSFSSYVGGSSTTNVVNILTSSVERMRIDSSGNVGIGTSSPGFKLEVVGGTNNGIHIKDAASATVFGGLFTQASNMALITRSNHALTFGTNDAERMRITSAGDVGIGTSSPSQKFHVSGSGSTYTRVSSSNAGSGAGSYFANATSTWLIGAGPASGGSEFQFVDQTSGSLERARITSNGDLLLNTTSTSLTSGIGAKFINSATDPYMGYVTTSSSGASNYHLYSTGAAAYRFYVDSSGTIYATSTTITSLSDQRLKENIQDIDVGLDAIMALKPRKFDWKAGKGKDKKGDRGWVAQEFEQVFPEMIDTWKDPAPEGEEPYKSVNADLIPVLVKAIQELKAEIDALKGAK